MRRTAGIVVGVQAALVAGLAVALRSGRMPLGVPGEWEWQRIKTGPSGLPLFFGLVALVAYSAFAAAGYRAISAGEGRKRLKTWLVGLVVASAIVQGFIQEAAPEGFGLCKWIFALHTPGSSGYYTVAKAQMGDTRRFLVDYPVWIEKQDALHVGTHPPGLFLVARGMLDLMEAHPEVARVVCDFSPPSTAMAIRAYREEIGLTRVDAASLAITGALILLACSMTVVPLYALARSGLAAPSSWVAAAAWPLVPSALMFQPAADAAFPLISTTALALACWSTRSDSQVRGLILCMSSGLVMALGMVFTLAFLPVGLVVALVLMTSPAKGWGGRFIAMIATGVSFLAGTLAWWVATSANPVAIWWINQRNHARFYVEYPRTYLAWLAENPVELAIGLGLPAAAWVGVGLTARREAPRVAWATASVLLILTLSGKNLSEVGRLWLPLMPPLLVAAGAGFARLGGGAWALGAWVTLMGLQALNLEATIQVVYPI